MGDAPARDAANLAFERGAGGYRFALGDMAGGGRHGPVGRVAAFGIAQDRKARRALLG